MAAEMEADRSSSGSLGGVKCQVEFEDESLLVRARLDEACTDDEGDTWAAISLEDTSPTDVDDDDDHPTESTDVALDLPNVADDASAATSLASAQRPPRSPTLARATDVCDTAFDGGAGADARDADEDSSLASQDGEELSSSHAGGVRVDTACFARPAARVQDSSEEDEFRPKLFDERYATLFLDGGDALTVPPSAARRRRRSWDTRSPATRTPLDFFFLAKPKPHSKEWNRDTHKERDMASLCIFCARTSIDPFVYRSGTVKRGAAQLISAVNSTGRKRAARRGLRSECDKLAPSIAQGVLVQRDELRECERRYAQRFATQGVAS